MKKKLVDFLAVSQDELRAIWKAYPAEDVRRLTLEVERYRRVMAEIDDHFKNVQLAWRDEVGGHLVALHMLKVLMQRERDRLG